MQTHFRSSFKNGVKTWKAKRIFWNSYRFGNVDYTDQHDLITNLGGFNALIGKGYGEIAAESRSQHKSQGFGVAAGRGEWPEYFLLTDGAKASQSITEGINLGWSRIGATKITMLVDAIIKNYRVDKPVHSVPALVALVKVWRRPAGS